MSGQTNLKSWLVISVVLVVLWTAVASGGVIYVDASASPGGNGQTWGTAYKYLQDALYKPPTGGDEIWVAAGTYKPDADEGGNVTPNDRTETFQLINGVQMYGGFPSGGGTWEQRDPTAYETILTGDINVPADNNDNSYHVVTGSGTDATAVLDGFTITSGNANVAVFPDQHGGGMYNYSGSPTVTNCTFSRNSARYCGGGMYNRENSAPLVTNCTLSGNGAEYGGGMYNYQSTPTLTNCVFSGNSGSNKGGGLYNHQGSPRVTNCILWGNSDNGGTDESAQIYNESSTPVINYCCVQGWTGALGGTGNIGDDPNFVDPNGPDDIAGTEDDNLRLSAGSPCIDVGDNSAIPPDTADLDGDGNTTEPIPFDLDGNARILGNVVDMGAYEDENPTLTLMILSTSSGSVSEPGEGNFQYSPGTFVPVVAQADPCYGFVEWTGTAVDAGKVADPCAATTTVTIDADYTLIANFDTHMLTVSSTSRGIVTSPGEGVFLYPSDTVVAIVAQADPCCWFVEWTGTAVVAGKVADPCAATTTVTVDADYTLVANFDTHTLTVSSSPGGSVSQPGQGVFEYAHGTVGPIVAEADAGCWFVEWTGTAVVAGKVADPCAASTTVTVDADYTLVANFDGPIFVDADAPGPTHDGRSWATAHKYLQGALADANSSAKAVEIWVAHGTYKPDEGSRVDLVTGLDGPGGIALDVAGGKMYWTDWHDIKRANLDGSSVEDLVTGLGWFEGIALDVAGGKMYLTEITPHKVRRANMSDGSSVEDLVTGLDEPFGIALDVAAGKMYWTDTDYDTGKIKRANLDGSSVEDLVTGLSYPCGIALDVASGKMYWTDAGTDKIQRANMSDGSSVEDLVTGLSYPCGIALDVAAGKMYWTDYETGKIQRANLDGSSFEDLVTGLDKPFGIALDVAASKMYWTDMGTDKIQRANMFGGTRLRTETFQLIDGVAIYGGFPSGGAWEQRDPNAYETILSGDIGTAGVYADNSYHVVTADGTDANTILDGFTITAGNANGSDPLSCGGGMYISTSGGVTVSNCSFTDNYADSVGGGMYISTSGGVTVSNCSFADNYADIAGGGMYIWISGSATVSNCSFTDNYAADSGGGMYISGSDSATVSNCSFTDNYADSVGGGMYCNGESAAVVNCKFIGNWASVYGGGMRLSVPRESEEASEVVNCTFYWNEASDGGGIYAASYSPAAMVMVTNCILWMEWPNDIAIDGPLVWVNVNYCCLQHWDGDGVGNILSYPLFLDPVGPDLVPGTGDEDLHLAAYSLCIDAGDNNSVPADTADLDGDGDTNEPLPFDLDGDTRLVGCRVDMGAYESRVPGGIIYVDDDSSGADNGTSWGNAYNHLQDALAEANSNPCVSQIWVAEGTYYADANSTYASGTNEREATFQLISGVAIYGGFPSGGDPNWNDRDPNAYETILSGDINTPGDNNDNSYHVVTGSSTDATAVLDGFTITAGNANGSYPNYHGGGMHNAGGSPTVTNCVFIGNFADSGGGMCNTEFSKPTVSNCIFTENSADGKGGGMFNFESDPAVSTCTFSVNWGNYGGGMCSRDFSNPIITNCTFIGNLANYGGGMWNRSQAATTLVNCTFSGNSSENDASAIINIDCNTTATNCIFSGHSGGRPAIYIFNYNQSATLILTNCTFQGNSSTLACGSDAQNYPSSVLMTNCILWEGGDEIWNSDGSIITINYSDVQGGWGGPGSNNIDDDPCFVDADGPDNIVGTEDDNLRLLLDSPCIDAGDNNSLPPDTADLDGDGNTTEPIPLDLGGKARILYSIVDMGAYEYGRVLFVNANAQGPAHNGLSWATAYKYLQDALAYANSNPDVNEIWVAQGIYHPDASSSYPGGTDDREASFELINGVGIYGGFAGHESSLHERDWQTNETILSGDLHSNDVDVNDPCDLLTEPTRADNSYHVVTGSETDQTAILDGFTITAGNANGFDLFDDTGGGVCNHDGARPTIRNCKFNGNSADSWGGGMCNDLSTPTLINCTFIGNSAKLGGGIVNYYWHPAGGPKLIHCTFSGNSAQYYGGGMCNLNVSPVITNCNFSGNSASLHGGGMWNEISEPNLTNCTFAGNSATNGNALACDSYQQSYPSNVQLANCILWDGGNEIWNNDSSTITITYSDVQGGWSGPGGNNISANPVFVDRDGADNIVGTDDDNLRLLLDSPCIDAGDNNSVPADTADVDGDLDGNPRIVCSIVDMGTYEFNYAYMGDFDYDCDVDFADFAIFALAWLTEPPDENWNPFCDISIPADSYIDWRDLKVLTDNWLAAK